MSIKLMNLVWDNGPDNCSETLVMLSLADNANDEGICWPSYNTISKKCRISKRYCIELIGKLETDGWISKTSRYIEGKQTSNLFIINISRLIRGEPQITGVVNPSSPPSELQITPPVNPSSPKPSFEPSIKPSVEAEEEIPYSTSPSLNKFDTINAKSNWGNMRYQDIEELYRLCTNQITIPSDHREKIFRDLGAILDHYGDIETAVPHGQRNFRIYINKDKKDNSGKYSTLSPGWIDKWLDVIYRERATQTTKTMDRLAKDKSI